MKKIIVGILGLLLGAGLILFVLRQKKSDDSQNAAAIPPSETASLTGPGPDDEALYDVSFDAKQMVGDKQGTIFSVKGTVAQSRQNGNEYLTTWKELSEFVVRDKAGDDALKNQILGKVSVATVTNGDIGYLVPKDFPTEFLTFHLSFLGKMIVPVSGNSNSPVTRTEKDEAGAAKIQYDFIEEGGNLKVLKTWDRYVQDAVKIDAEDNYLTYILTPENRLISAKGQLTLHYREPQPIHFTTSLKITFKSAVKKAPTAIAKEEFTKTDLQRAAAEVLIKSAPKDAPTFEESLKALDKVTTESEGRDVYDLFTKLKTDVIADPSRADVIIAKILESTKRDEATKRRLAVLFGALAQSQATEISDSLAKLATDCPDSFCKVQAIVGLNDHPNPSSTSAEKMLSLASSTKDDEISGTALLAAGSVAKKLQDGEVAITQELAKELKNPARAEMKNTIIAAMGNHGSSDYYVPLMESAKDKDSGTRASALYSMRYLPNSEVNGLLVNAFKSDPSLEVRREAVKAMAYRNLTREEYVEVASIAANAKDRDLAQDAARILVNAYRDDPQTTKAAIDSMIQESKHKEVAAWIEKELKPAAPPTPGAPGLHE